jgi:hypothetical protein
MWPTIILENREIRKGKKLERVVIIAPDHNLKERFRSWMPL